MPEKTIELSYDSADAVPAEFKGLYDEKDGKFVLAGVSGMKTQQDVMNVQEALRKEREDHSKAKEALKGWKNFGDDPTALQTKLDRIAELEAAAGGKLDENAIQKLVDARLGQKTAPLERQLRDIMTERDTVSQERDALRNAIMRRDMNDAVRAIATEMKVLPTAIPDVEMVAAAFLERDQTTGDFVVKADAKGLTPGGDIKSFMKDMQKTRPHWWPASAGGGAGGGGGFQNADDNPWSPKGWNLTRQGAYMREHGQAKAEQAAKAVGSFIGATHPPSQSK